MPNSDCCREVQLYFKQVGVHGLKSDRGFANNTCFIILKDGYAKKLGKSVFAKMILAHQICKKLNDCVL